MSEPETSPELHRAAKPALLTSLLGLKKNAMATLREAVSLAESVYHADSVHEGMFADLKGDWENSCQFALDAHELDGVFAAAIQKSSLPAIVNENELCEALEVYAFASDPRISSDPDSTYDCFLDFVQLRLLSVKTVARIPLCQLLQVREEPNPLARWMWARAKAEGRAEIPGTETPPMDSDVSAYLAADEPKMPPLWSANGVSLTISGLEAVRSVQSLDVTQGQSDQGTLVAELCGEASPAAFQAIQDELVPCVRSLLRSISLFREHSTLSASSQARLPIVFASELAEYRVFISSCSSKIFAGPHKKDSMERRFANSVRLLAESDRQTSVALRLAISIAAIEALLGRKGDSISTTLSDCIAVLLEPKLEYRNLAAGFFKQLYDARSRTLHGESVDADESLAGNARILAAGCLYGLWFRDDLRRRMGEPADAPEQLLQQLRDQKWAAEQPEGVPELPAIQQLWRKSGRLSQ